MWDLLADTDSEREQYDDQRHSNKKRKAGDDKGVAIQPKSSKPSVETTWHPRFNGDTAKVILLSNDNRKFCVARDILSAHR
jgi:hypothetical protein